MASALFTTLQLFHITSAAVVLGYLAFAPFWRALGMRANDAKVLGATMQGLRDGLVMMALPAMGVLIVSGIAMSFRATSDQLYDIRVARWLQASVVVAIVLAIMLYGLLTPLKKMAPLVDAGEAKGPAMDKLWGEWRTSLLMASLLALVATGLMIYNSLDLRLFS